MLQAVRGVYRGGVVELLEKPAGVVVADVVVTFLPSASGADPAEAPDAEEAVRFSEDAPPLDDFEPILPARPILLSDIVLEGRR